MKLKTYFKHLLSILFFTLISFTLTAQLLTKQWDVSFGGAGIDDNVTRIQQTSDGGYIVGGRPASDIGGNKTSQATEATIYGSLNWIKTALSNGIKVLGETMMTNFMPFYKHQMADSSWADVLPPASAETEAGPALVVHSYGESRIVSSLAGGVYTVKLVSQEKVMYKQFVKL